MDFSTKPVLQVMQAIFFRVIHPFFPMLIFQLSSMNLSFSLVGREVGKVHFSRHFMQT